MNMMLGKAKRILMGLTRLTPRDWRDLVEAQLALVIAQTMVWAKPIGQLIAKTSSDETVVEEPIKTRSNEWREAYRASVAVRRAADHGVIRPQCLVRSLALSRMLQRRGFHGSRVRVGVKRLDGQFSAHAWVELRGRVLGDKVRHVGSFHQLLNVSVTKSQLIDRAVSRGALTVPTPYEQNVPVNRGDSREQSVSLFI